MDISAVGQVVRVAAVDGGSSTQPNEAAPAGIIGMAPITVAALDNGLTPPRGDATAVRPSTTHAAGDRGDAALLALAQRKFIGERHTVVEFLRRESPALSTAAVDEVADQWVARSMRRYRNQLDGQYFDLQYLSPAALLLTIAYEGRRPAGDPIRAAAEAYEAKEIGWLTNPSPNDDVFTPRTLEEATFTVRTSAARLSHSTQGWEAELPR